MNAKSGMKLPSTIERARRRCTRLIVYSHLSYLAYRYRYLTVFTLIGVSSLLMEIALARFVMPASWPWLAQALVAFGLGLMTSFLLNATFNFRVPKRDFVRTFQRFALVSVISFALNMLAVACFYNWIGPAYGEARLVSAAILFLVAYSLHRRFTFDMTRNFGIALYASREERLYEAFLRIGRKCDHVHMDLVDESFNPRCAPVEVGRVRLARKLWNRAPICLHIMSRRPRHWMEQTWDDVDWYLFHTNIDDEPLKLVVECRMRGKKVGVVWHRNDAVETLFPLLPHVDFVMVLGIAEPGRSGQQLLDEALAVTDMLHRIRGNYRYEVMVDGGVNPQTIRRLPAKYVVAASSVLRANNPILSLHRLKTESRYERIAA
ncbi:MAG: GtrA family protein [Planctomycetes bacterium]|nr:GtrA family protein [Planctomycetota bacterium]